MVRNKGVYYFYDDGHEKCFQGMKVKPLSRAFKVLHAWITGQRNDESPGDGSGILVVQREHSFEGIDVGIGRLVKWNYVTNTDSHYICRVFPAMYVLLHSLQAPGYATVVSEPFARPVLPWQRGREGRWWWEDANAKGRGVYEEKIKQEMARLGEHKNGVGSHTNGCPTITGSFNSPCFGYRQAMEESYVELADKLADAKANIAKLRADGNSRLFSKQELKPGNLEQSDVHTLMAFVNTQKQWKSRSGPFASTCKEL